MSYPFYISGESTFQRYLIADSYWEWFHTGKVVRYAGLAIQTNIANNFEVGETVEFKGIRSNGTELNRAPRIIGRPKFGHEQVLEHWVAENLLLDGIFVVSQRPSPTLVRFTRSVNTSTTTGGAGRDNVHVIIQRTGSPSPRKPTLLSGAWIARPRL
jgi:hypothetical protein